MKKSKKEAIIKKLYDLNFEKQIFGYTYELPLGKKNRLFFEIEDMEIGIISDTGGYIEIRKVESPEDLENIFNAICPEKYRLPFN